MTTAARTLQAPKRRRRQEIRNDLLPLRGDTPAPGPFIYFHYPRAWEYLDGHGWLPKLSKQVVRPGINGIPQPRRGEAINPAACISVHISKGAVHIDPLDRRLLLPGEDPDNARFYDYARYYECSDGRRYYVEPGQQPTWGRDGVIKWNHDAALAEHCAFRKHLMAAGIVDEFHALDYRDRLDNQRTLVTDLTARVSIQPGLAMHLQRAERRLEGMQRSWEELNSGGDEEQEVHTPRPRRPKKGQS